ncbi:DUF3231 family protein [Paenibacillus sp. CGMCC 1.16610]|uniref:DUF3231 family protein n=1 Tax=Paenibacillus anseongense TaxID=2682845 RepID=A0ABW9U4V6_9BACL|nr:MULTISPECIES: DUF3231 family protein [Paenibacillus]MBA2939099.1 DUF3231 family protein [Paenibacillus sp. CGMCC 1.16610]MVQ35058.1 DUF3231 family protein [Paenibacillus anseongense]
MSENKEVLEKKHDIRLTSGELTPLWAGYQGDSMANCVLKYFLNKVEDAEVKPIVEYALGLTEEHMEFKNSLFKNEKFPIPLAFTDNDVNINAPRLFSDCFMLLYLRNMGIAGTVTYSMALASSSRQDIRAFFNHNLKTAAELLEKATTTLQSKGLLPRSPYIPYPDSVEFVQKEGWLNGVLGDRRPINGSEITQLFLNIMTNCVGQALMLGFSQVARTKEVVEYILRGRDISAKHIEVFSSVLRDDKLPAPMTWETDISNSKEAPFSEKLMLYHTVFLSTLGLGNYGAALATSTRRDLATLYLRLIAEIGTFADDGAELLIKNKWMEKMPGAIERNALLSM